MDNRIRLLGIVPYEGMKTLLLRVAAEYPQVDLDVFVGNMEEGWRSPEATSTTSTVR